MIGIFTDFKDPHNSHTKKRHKITVKKVINKGKMIENNTPLLCTFKSSVIVHSCISFLTLTLHQISPGQMIQNPSRLKIRKVHMQCQTHNSVTQCCFQRHRLKSKRYVNIYAGKVMCSEMELCSCLKLHAYYMTFKIACNHLFGVFR